MSGTGSPPPGTQWLQGQTRRRQRRRRASPLQRQQLQDLSGENPAIGAWQYMIAPLVNGQWQVQGSSPQSDDWDTELSTHDDLGDAVQQMQDYRDNGGPDTTDT